MQHSKDRADVEIHVYTDINRIHNDDTDIEPAYEFIASYEDMARLSSRTIVNNIGETVADSIEPSENILVKLYDRNRPTITHNTEFGWLGYSESLLYDGLRNVLDQYRQ